MSRFRPKRLWRKRAFALAAAMAAAQSVQAGGFFDTRADCNNGGAPPSIGVPTLAGAAQIIANPSTLTTTGTILAGSEIIVAAYVDGGGLGNSFPTGVTDSAGDTYSAVGTTMFNTANPHGGFNTYIAHTGGGLAVGSKIIVTWNVFNASVSVPIVVAGSVTGAGAKDVEVQNSGSGTFPSLSTGTLNKSPSLAIGTLGVRGTSSGAATNFTLLSVLNGGSHEAAIYYQTTQSAGTGSVTFAPAGSGNNVLFDQLFNLYATAPAC